MLRNGWLVPATPLKNQPIQFQNKPSESKTMCIQQYSHGVCTPPDRRAVIETCVTLDLDNRDVRVKGYVEPDCARSLGRLLLPLLCIKLQARREHAENHTIIVAQKP